MRDADDEVLSLPDQENIDQNIKELLENGKEEKKNKRAGSKTKIAKIYHKFLFSRKI